MNLAVWLMIPVAIFIGYVVGECIGYARGFDEAFKLISQSGKGKHGN